jgi:hypothetical protein
MIPPKIAYEPTPVDGAKFIDPNDDLSWTPGVNATLHTVYFGDNFDDVNNASGGHPQGSTTYALETLELDKTYYWRVDEFDVITTYKGDIWSFKTLSAGGNLMRVMALLPLMIQATAITATLSATHSG